MSTADTSIRDILELAQNLTQGREFFVGQVADRLKQASAQCPHNQIIRALEFTFISKAKKLGSIAPVSQKDIQEYYDQVSGLGNQVQARELLGDLLLVKKAEVSDYRNDAHVNSLRAGEEELQYLPTEQVAELTLALWNNPGSQVMKRSFLENGRKGLQIELQSMGFANPTVEVSADNNDFVVYSAEVDTRRGKTSFFIPAEIKLGSVLMPSVFVSGSDFSDLTAENIKYFLNSKDIKKSATPKGILDTLNRITGKKAHVDTSFDNVSLQGSECFSEQYAQDEAPSQYITETAEVPAMPKALAGLSEAMIKETLLEAGLSYPRSIVLQAKATLSNELKLARVQHERITVDSEFNGGMILSTNVSGAGGKKKIEVPVEVKNNRPLMPSHFTSGAFASSFDEKSIKAFADSQEGAENDPLLNDKYAMSFPELHKVALKKAAYGDFIEATEILGIINSKFGSEFHNIAHHDLMDLLKAGYSEETKPVSFFDKFVAESSRKAADKENQIRLMTNPMMFYPKE